MGTRQWTGGVEPEEGEVTLRCGPCHDQGASAPTLARVLWRGRYRTIDVPAPRVTQRKVQADQAAGDLEAADAYKGHRASWDVPHPHPDRYWSRFAPNGARVIGKAIELRSRFCRHRPRKTPRDLYALADQTLARGEDVAYVYG